MRGLGELDRAAVRHRQAVVVRSRLRPNAPAGEGKVNPRQASNVLLVRMTRR